MQNIFEEASQFAGLVNSGLIFSVVHGNDEIVGTAGKVSSEMVHWGSCAKALTATVVAVLVDQKKLTFESTLSDLGFGEKKFATSTIDQLLRHQVVGMPEDLPEETLKRLNEELKDAAPEEARKVYVDLLFKEKGDLEGHRYSNAGYVLLSHVLEVALQTPWERLVQETIANPLGLSTLGFGMPAGLVGHDENDEPQPLFRDSSFHNAPFAVHSSIQDWMKFARLYFALLQNKEDAFQLLGVSDKTARRLITPTNIDVGLLRGGELPQGYAAGWRTRW